MYVSEAALLIRHPILPSSKTHYRERRFIIFMGSQSDPHPHTCWLVFESRGFMLQHLTTMPLGAPGPRRSSDVPDLALQTKYVPGIMLCLKGSIISDVWKTRKTTCLTVPSQVATIDCLLHNTFLTWSTALLSKIPPRKSEEPGLADPLHETYRDVFLHCQRILKSRRLT
jgi:hypothetical protein